MFQYAEIFRTECICGGEGGVHLGFICIEMMINAFETTDHSARRGCIHCGENWS